MNTIPVAGGAECAGVQARHDVNQLLLSEPDAEPWPHGTCEPSSITEHED